MLQISTHLGLNATSGSIVSNTARSFWTKCVSETRITNSSNGNVEVVLYLFNTKRDSLKAQTVLWQTGLYDEAASSLIDYTAQQGVTPFDSKIVGQFFQCYNVKTKNYSTPPQGVNQF